MNYKRLTKRDKFGEVCVNNTYPCEASKSFTEINTAVWNKLAEYEDDEEQGLIKRFPCKVGDTVYSIWGGIGQDQTVKVDTVCYFTVRDKVYVTTDYIDEGELGVDVFLTEKEAEKKLEELNK